MHCLVPDWNRFNVMLAVERMTGKIDSARIAAYTKRVIDTYTDENTLLGAMTADGAETAATDALVGAGNGVTCFAHTIQLGVRDGLAHGGFAKAFENVRGLIVYCRSKRHIVEALKAAKKRAKKAAQAAKRR